MSFKNLFVIEEEKGKNLENENDIFQQSKYQEISPQNENEKIGGILSHLSAFLGYFIPFGHILAPLAIWIFRKDKEDDFVRENAKAALNFQCSFTIYLLIGVLVYLFSIIFLTELNEKLFLGFMFGPIVLFYLLEFIFILLAVRNTSSGKVHKYPFTINFFK